MSRLFHSILHAARRHQAVAWLAVLAFYLATPFPPAPWDVTLGAQTALSSTTLAAAITDTSGQVMTVTSATGFTAPGTGATMVLALIDREIVQVRTVSGTTIGILRGQNGTRAATHINTAPVLVMPPSAVYSNIPSGQCTRTLLTYVPYVVGGGPGLGSEVGTVYDCLGVTTAGQWTPTNTSGIPVFGSTVVSANTIAPTGTYFKTSGTTVIKTITVPAGAAPGFSITIEATGLDTWDATGNILTAGTFTAAGHTVTFYWNGAKWVPDKVA